MISIGSRIRSCRVLWRLMCGDITVSACNGCNRMNRPTSTAFLRELIDTNGWPARDQVGTEAAHAAWLLAQHADAAPDLQAQVLELMEPLVVAGQADGGDLAYLTDRVRPR